MRLDATIAPIITRTTIFCTFLLLISQNPYTFDTSILTEIADFTTSNTIIG